MKLTGSIEYVPIELATAPRDGECLCNRWWSFMPDRGLIFYRMGGGLHPQCNYSREVAERLTAKLYPEAEVLFVPVVFTGPARRVVSAHPDLPNDAPIIVTLNPDAADVARTMAVVMGCSVSELLRRSLGLMGFYLKLDPGERLAVCPPGALGRFRSVPVSINWDAK